MSQRDVGQQPGIDQRLRTSEYNKRKYSSLSERTQVKNARRRKLECIASTSSPSITTHPDPLNQIPNSPDILPAVPNCTYCNAKRLHSETPSFCCSVGEIKLSPTEMPSELLQLYLSNSDDGTHFRDCIRSYNNMFAFTSIGGGHCDETLATRNQGIYTYRVQGQLYHQIHQLNPPDEHPKYLQLYYYDTENEISHRMSISPKFREPLVAKLIDILQRNPYATFFRSLNSLTNLSEYKIALHTDPICNPHVFNKPTVSQVAAIWLESDIGQLNTEQHIQVYSQNNEPQPIKQFFGCYDSLQYPLIFPNGDPGWHRGINRFSRKRNILQNTYNDTTHDIRNYTSADAFLDFENQISTNKDSSKRVSCRQYYCYKLQIRENDKSFLLHTGRLLQQYVVDMYIKIETSRLQFFRNDEMQSRLRNEVYHGLVDGIAQGCRTGADVGKRFILPSSFIGGPRDMRNKYMDAIALVRHYGKPDIFLTITSNPNWPEIKALCLPSDEIQNRPDLVARVFRSKLEMLKKELFKKKIFGEVIAYTYVIEFQKRGLPHAHFLLILSRASKMFSAEAFDRIVSAELPDPQKEPYLFSLVIKHMMHGPCGIHNPSCACMRNNSCKSNYPKDFSDSTTLGNNSYPIYRRRSNGSVVTIRGAQLDNRWVIPYNRYLLAKFNCHMNVEICSTIQAVKYIYKYIYKGHDKILYTLLPTEQEPAVDEIKTFQKARWISPPEAVWRIFGFDLSQIHPSVIRLPLHLENHQSVTFSANQSLESITANSFLKKTMLTQFFNTNKYNTFAKTINCLYVEFPQYFTWHTNSREWEPRKKREVIGRIVNCSPIEGERFYLRLLLMHVKGPTSFQHLRTVNGIVFDTYRDAAKALGLMEADDTIEMCLHEASTYIMPAALRQLFATILIYCNPQNPKDLFLKFEDFLSEDFKQDKTITLSTVRHKVLDSLTNLLHPMGKTLKDFFSFHNDIHKSSEDNFTRELAVEKNIVVSSEDLLAVIKLNEAQRFAYDQILYHVNNNSPKVFFVDGPGGTGKTFLYRALLATIRSAGGIVLATATSGVAASLLPGGRTSHSRFKIPLHENESRGFSVSKQSTLAYLIKVAKMIIWDEATMAKRNIIEKFDEMLRDIMGTNIIFGGKIIVFGGDFRQTLPVIINGTRQEIINSTIVMSPLWKQFEKLKLTQNMRALLDPEFSNYLLKVGDGTENGNSQDEIMIPQTINLCFTNDIDSLNLLIDMVFPGIDQTDFDVYSFVTRAILTTRNEFVHEINDVLIARFLGDEVTYFACDESVSVSGLPDQQELYHTLTPTGLPPHRLILKKNAPIILLRNINPSEGLCNGTRLICKSFDKNIIYAEISVGSFAGKSVFIPRITLEAPQDNFSCIPFKRKQFPVRLCFAMTINKAQGQTLDFVGVYLKEPVFSHGQLYVALSRAKTINQLKVLIRPLTPLIQNTNYTKNVVYKEVLTAANA